MFQFIIQLQYKRKNRTSKKKIEGKKKQEKEESKIQL